MEHELAPSGESNVRPISLWTPEMKLTSFQRKVLLRYEGFRIRPPTPLRLLARVLPHLLSLLVLVILSAYTLPETVTAFLGGVLAGAVVYQVSFAMGVAKSVATLVEFIDWNKVDRALKGDGE
jgi:hypothetical protein